MLKSAVGQDVVVVVPITPGSAPRLDCTAADAASWLERTHAFAALTALGGCPCVVVPAGQLHGDDAPLALALFGPPRTDQRLLAVAERLAPHVLAESLKLRASAKKAEHGQQLASQPTGNGGAAAVTTGAGERRRRRMRDRLAPGGGGAAGGEVRAAALRAHYTQDGLLMHASCTATAWHPGP